MGTTKITGFMISIVLIGLFASIFVFFLSGISNGYGVSYDNTSLINYSSKLDETYEISKEVQEGTDLSVDAGIFDIVGAYFTSAYKSLKITVKSFGLFTTMSDEMFSNANLGEISDSLKTAIITIVIIMVFVGILISVLVKRERL